MLSAPLSLRNYLEKIDQVFGLQQLKTTEVTHQFTQEYYRETGKYYRWLHSPDGAMHFPLHTNPSRKAHREGLYRHPLSILSFIKKHSIKEVLELGCGQGFNSLFLAEHLPAVRFTAIDLTPANIERAQAKARAKNLVNLEFRQGDFNALPYPDAQFDFIFAIECLCHSQDHSQTLCEIYRLLASRGYLLVYDGYQEKPNEQLDLDWQLANEIFSVAFAVKQFAPWPEWHQIACRIGLEMLEEVDYSQAILPNLQRFQEGGMKVFQYPLLTKLLLQLRLFPTALIKHSIAGIVAPFLMEAGIIGYHKTVMRKVSESH